MEVTLIASGGNGNVVDNKYCLHLGNDCSATCCIQQQWGATIADWEFGYETDEFEMYYITAIVIFIVIAIPVLIKLALTYHRYFCFFLYAFNQNKVQKKVTPDKKNANSNSMLRFESNIMKDLESSNFTIDESLDREYNKNTNNTTTNQLLNSIRRPIDILKDK